MHTCMVVKLNFLFPHFTQLLVSKNDSLHLTFTSDLYQLWFSGYKSDYIPY